MKVVAHYETGRDDQYARDVRELVYESKCTKDEMYRAVMVIVRAAQNGSLDNEEEKRRRKRDEKLKRKAGCCFNVCCCCVGSSRLCQAIGIFMALFFVYRVLAQLVGLIGNTMPAQTAQ